jgi:hypothetical protein
MGIGYTSHDSNENPWSGVCRKAERKTSSFVVLQIQSNFSTTDTHGAEKNVRNRGVSVKERGFEITLIKIKETYR